ncbi:MAG: ABC transporter permease subunit [Massilia sp.]|nr:ABC transporter permease subunit [Massilia sp.]
MPDQFLDLLPELGNALGQTLTMLAIGVTAAIVLGGPLGILLFLAGTAPAPAQRPLARLLGWTVDTIRAFPFAVLLVALLPVTRIVAGTAIGPLAAAVPLSIAGVPWFARRVEQTLRDVPRGVVEAGRAMGGSELQVVLHVLLVEARPGLVVALAALVVSVLSYAAVTGIVGGGGIGEFVLRYGYERFDADIMVFTAALLAALVQVIQLTGARWARRVDRR